jgi:hypothetical protein
MSKKDYKQAFEAAEHELRTLQTKREEIDKRIGKLKTVINNLDALCGNKANDLPPSSLSSMGITDLIRLALKHSAQPMKPSEVAEQVHAWRADLDKNHNLLASTHTVLKRLIKSGEAEEVPALGRKKAYKWISDISRVLKGMHQDKGRGFAE